MQTNAFKVLVKELKVFFYWKVVFEIIIALNIVISLNSSL